MRLKKSIIIVLFLLCILTIGAVSASENVTDDKLSNDVNDDSISTHDNLEKTSQKEDILIENKKASNNDAEVISEGEYSPTSFKALNQKINDAPEGSEIELDNDYTYNESSDSELKIIKISKKITIKGNGKTIDAKGKTGIFNIVHGANVIIENLKFINSYGGAISIIADEEDNKNSRPKLTIINSKFSNNMASYDGNGGAITTRYSDISIINTQFIDNFAQSEGGAIKVGDYSNINITNSVFTNNSVHDYGGGAIFAERITTKIYINNTTFQKNRAPHGTGGAIDTSIPDENQKGIAINMVITNTKFIENSAEKGGAIRVSSISKININNTLFKGNDARVDITSVGGAIFNHGILTVNFSTFIENSAYAGGAIQSAGELTVTDSTFTKDYADTNGNGIYIAKGNTANIRKSTFNEDDVYCKEGSVDLSDSTFNNTKKPNTPSDNPQKPSNGDSSTTSKVSADSSTKVTQKTVKITAPKKTFKRKVKVKKYTVTVKSSSKFIKGLKLTLKIKGKKYSATTNNKGKAVFKIRKLTKKGTYKATITFKGDKNYKASKKTVKIIVK